MISIRKILKQSWQILWNYRILWVFGLLLAITSSGSMSGGNTSNYQVSEGDVNSFPRVLSDGAPQWVRQLGEWFVQNVEPLFTHPELHIQTFVMIGVVLFLIVLLFSTLAAFIRYPSETAVIRMVDEYENSGSKLGFRQGWKLGWNRRAFRLWLIDLILSLPVIVLVLLIIGAGVLVYFSVSATFQVTNLTGVVIAIGLGFLSLFLMILASVFLTLLRNFFARAAALENLGVKESIKYGWAMFKRNWKNAGRMWLVMVGIGIGFGIAGLIAFFILIPAYLVLLVPAALIAAIPALIALGISNIFASGPLVWVITVLAALPFFFTAIFSPLILFNGWFKIFESNVWTLTYREIKAMENLKEPEIPAGSVKKAKKKPAA